MFAFVVFVSFPFSMQAEERTPAGVIGFESSEGFSSGFIGDQAGWQAWVGNTSQPIISTENPASGNQHVRIENHPGIPPDTIVGALSPDFGQQSETEISEVIVKIAISAIGGSYYTIRAQDLSASMATWEFTFDDGDRMFVLDDYGFGPQLIAVPDTYLWSPGSYHTLRVVTDPVGGSIQYFLDTILVYTGNTIGGSTVQQIEFICDNYVGSHADFDELFVSPGSDAIFENGFETGDFFGWDGVVR